MRNSACRSLRITLGLVACSLDTQCTTFAAAQSVADVPVASASRVDDRLISRGEFGRSIALEGDTLVVGFGGLLGGADVFARQGSTWVYEDSIFVGGINSEDEGYSVAIDGSRIAIGAPFSDADLGFSEDVAVWERQGTSWTNLGQLGPQLFIRFGEAVDISGDSVIVGAPWLGAGAVLLYGYDGVAWTQERVVSATCSGLGCSGLGRSVSLDVDVAVAGAPFHPTEQLFVLRRVGSDWSVEQVLSIADMGDLAARGYTSMGARVAVDGDTLLVTAVGPPATPGTEPVVLVLEDSGSGYAFQYALRGHDSERADAFGSSLALEGEHALIAAERDTPGGAVYHFQRDGSGVFRETAKYLPTSSGSSASGPGFGSAIGISGNALAIGAESDTSVPANGVGAAYVIEDIANPSLPRAFCTGTGSGSTGCGNCPCGNNDDPDAIGGCLNADGRGAVLSMSGEARIAQDALRFEVTGARASSVALLLSGITPLPMNPHAVGCVRGEGIQSVLYDGLRCIGGSLARHGSRPTSRQGHVGDGNVGWGGSDPPMNGLLSQAGATAGQNRFFQVVYRDLPSKGCGTGLNTSNAISVFVLP